MPGTAIPLIGRTVREETPDIFGRYVPFDDIPLNDRRVTRCQASWDPDCFLDAVDVRHVVALTVNPCSSRCATHIEQQPQVGDL